MRLYGFIEVLVLVKKKWSEEHDVILFYSKSKEFIFNLDAVRENEIGESTYKRFKKDSLLGVKLLTAKCPLKANSLRYTLVQFGSKARSIY